LLPALASGTGNVVAGWDSFKTKVLADADAGVLDALLAGDFVSSVAGAIDSGFDPPPNRFVQKFIFLFLSRSVTSRGSPNICAKNGTG
jgi:hypothetical protein